MRLNYLPSLFRPLTFFSPLQIDLQCKKMWYTHPIFGFFFSNEIPTTIVRGYIYGFWNLLDDCTKKVIIFAKKVWVGFCLKLERVILLLLQHNFFREKYYFSETWNFDLSRHALIRCFLQSHYEVSRPFFIYESFLSTLNRPILGHFFIKNSVLCLCCLFPTFFSNRHVMIHVITDLTHEITDLIHDITNLIHALILHSPDDVSGHVSDDVPGHVVIIGKGSPFGISWVCILLYVPTVRSLIHDTWYLHREGGVK